MVKFACQWVEKYNIINLLKSKKLGKIKLGGKAVAKNTQKQVNADKNVKQENKLTKEVKQNTNLTKEVKVDNGLTQEEQIILKQHKAMSAANRKLIKKQKQAFRYKKIVYRLKSRLPSNASRIYYPFRKKEIDKLLGKRPKQKSTARHTSKRRKNMAIALLLLLLIVSVVGVGTYFIYQSLTSHHSNRVPSGEVIFVNSDSMTVPIENARLNKDIEKPVIIKNKTTTAVYVRFKVEITDEDGEPATGDLEQLDIRYTYDMNKWYLDSAENYLYYKGWVLRDAELQPITHFQIYSANANENYWVGRTIGIKFTVEVEQTRDSGEDRPPHWSKGWHNVMNRH